MLNTAFAQYHGSSLASTWDYACLDDAVSEKSCDTLTVDECVQLENGEMVLMGGVRCVGAALYCVCASCDVVSVKGELIFDYTHAYC